MFKVEDNSDLFEDGNSALHMYISLTDIARFKNPTEPKDVVANWMQTRSTIEFLGLWEKLHNPTEKCPPCSL